jgi:hypothetical protein
VFDGTNVGIGTSSPAFKLAVVGSSSNSIASFYQSGASLNTDIYVNNVGSANNFLISRRSNGESWLYNSGADPLVFSTSGTERMRVDSSGNVGIGTTSPSGAGGTKNLLVESNGITIIKANTSSTTTGTARFDYGTGTANSYLISALNDNSGSPYYQLAGGSAVLTSYTDITTHIWRNTGGGTEYMRIASSGNVGIATSSPSAKLQIIGSTTISSQANVAAVIGSGVTSELLLGSTNGNTPFVASQGAYPLTFFTNAAERMRIDSSGNVGIGTSSPSASAILDAQSTTKGVRFPNMTPTQKNAVSSPAAGLVVFDTTLAKLCVYSGSAWETVTSV